MQDSLDYAYAQFSKILDEVSQLDKKKWSEADTRTKVISRILYEVLGWSKNEASEEERAGSGYTDYTLKIDNKAKAIVEAKRDNIPFGFEARQSSKAYILNGKAFNTEAKDAINQAVVYSAFKNCELACATNGDEWIVFRALRMGDGKETLEGKGFIFSSLASIKENFRLFYDLLSKYSAEILAFRGEFQKAEGLPIRDLSFFKPARNPLTKKLLDRGEYASDFDVIMSTFFERLKGDEDHDMIKKCFVVSSESDLADEKLLRLTQALAEKIRRINSDTGKQLVELIEGVKLQQKNRFVLLVGNKGAGKTTFIDRFFDLIIPAKTKDSIVLLRADLSFSTGDADGVIEWLNRELLKICEDAVFTSEKDGWDECVGKIFFDEYQRWSTRTMVNLYEKDKGEFKIEFGRHIEKIREDRPHEYIKRLIAYITKSNLKIPCIIFDNTDHYSVEFQERVFQYARSIYESELCIVIMPITDKTSWQLSKQGALQSFESEYLSLPTPKPDQIIERRISYLFEKLKDEERGQEYFFSKGVMRLKVNDIAKFASSLNQLLVESSQTSQWIGGLANNEVRRLLELTRDVISSPHLRLDDLFKAQVIGTSDVIPEYKIKNALIKRRYDIYPVGEHSFIQNVFSNSLENPSSPLLGVRVLQFLRDVNLNENDTAQEEYEYIPTDSVYEYFAMMNIAPATVKQVIAQQLKFGLVLNADPTIIDIEKVHRIRLSPSGRVHLSWATYDVDYIQIMKDITPLRCSDTHSTIINSYRNFRVLWRSANIAFINYLLTEDAMYCIIPEHSDFSRQSLINKKLERLSRKLEDEQRRAEAA